MKKKDPKLHYAKSVGRQNEGGLYGRACCGHYRSYVYGDTLYISV